MSMSLLSLEQLSLYLGKASDILPWVQNLRGIKKLSCQYFNVIF
jgi:hypothetical protein